VVQDHSELFGRRPAVARRGIGTRVVRGRA
jgi:hypothetical protein